VRVVFILQGLNLFGYGLSQRDYNVTIGNDECKIEHVTDNWITCKPPSEKPSANNTCNYCPGGFCLFVSSLINAGMFSSLLIDQ